MKPLTISTWNMEELDNRNATVWNARAPVLKPMIDRTKADILLLQEINSIDALNELRQGTQYENYHITHTTTDSG
jgi:exonuclease III